MTDGDGLKSGDIVGQAGIEKVYNAMLMGEDGARRVVVNSLGREIRTLEEDAPNEGKRVALTVDYDLQKALEDGFKLSGFNGASVIMDPKTGEVLAFTSVPSYDPNAFAAGIDRATWASLNTDDLKPLQDRAIQGRYPPGSTFKMAVATAALEEGVITPDFKVYCPGHADVLRPIVPVLAAQRPGPRHHRSAPGDREVVQRLLLHRRQHGRHRQDPQVGDAARPRREDRHRSAERDAGAGAVAGVEARAVQGEVVRRRDDLGLDRPGRGGADADLDGGLHLDDRQRRHPPDAASPQGGGRWDRMEGCAAAGAAFGGAVEAGDDPGDPRRAVDGRQRRPAPAARAQIPGRDVSGKTGTAQVISLEGGKAAKGRSDKDLRDNGWFVFFAPRDNPQIAGVVFVEHGGHGGTTAAPIAKHVLETFFAKQDGQPLPVLKGLATTPVDGDEPIAPPVAVTGAAR